MASRDVLRLDVLVVLWRWRWCLVCCMVCILKVVGISLGLRLYLCLRSSVELVVLLCCCLAVLFCCRNRMSLWTTTSQYRVFS